MWILFHTLQDMFDVFLYVFPFYMEAHTFVHDVQNEIHVPVFIYLLLKIHKYKSNKTRCSLVYATGQNNWKP